MQVSLAKHTITAEAAQALARAAIEAARARGLSVGVCVTDAEGAPMALLRMDGVGAPIVDFCSEKAYTAAVTGAATRDFHAHITSTPSLAMGMTGRPRFLVWGGGVPVCSDEHVIGGIGISGGTEDEDIEIASEALKAMGFE
ncbi:GlcG/HbpS family heme-binding protein [Martelella sp. AMO21009]